MADNDRPWEPPLAGTEAEHLVGALDRLRTAFRWKAAGLDEAGLLKHLALVEDLYSTSKMRGESPGQPWEDVDWDADPDWEFSSAAEDTPAELYALWDQAVERSRARFAAALADGGPEQPIDAADDEGRHASLRRLLCDLIVEYGRHTGHADLLRESVDGLVGEDPPDGWRA
jgi:hypothetical protein